MKSLILSFIFVFFAGCSNEPATKSHLVLSLGNLDAVTYPGGLLVQVIESKTGVIKNFELTSSPTITLPFGTWTFHIVGFPGPELWKGTPECGSSSAMNLNSQQMNINISVGSLKCSALPFVALLATKGAFATAIWDDDTAKWGQTTWAP